MRQEDILGDESSKQCKISSKCHGYSRWSNGGGCLDNPRGIPANTRKLIVDNVELLGKNLAVCIKANPSLLSRLHAGVLLRLSHLLEQDRACVGTLSPCKVTSANGTES